MSLDREDKKFLAPFKKHEGILNNKNESFKNKIESLVDVWKSVAELDLSQFDIRHVIQIMDWAKLHALNIVLTAEWAAFKEIHQEPLLQQIEKAQNQLIKLNNAFATRCKKLADVVKNPWEDPVLMNLMKTKDLDVGPEEIEFFCVETAYLVSVRLKKLCESHCEDLALNLVTAFMTCNRLSKIQNFSLNATDTQMWFIFDIHIALLYKFQEKQKIVVLLKELTFEEGLQLVKRFAKKRVKISKIWKNCQKVAILATQIYISQAVVNYTDKLKDILESYIEMYITLSNEESLLQDFPNSIRRISNLADAAGLYVFCDVIQRKAGSTLKPFVIEMYIRALTTDMNELERQKDANELAKVEIITSRLANAFVSLAEFLDEHVKVARECVLTAFSLAPTKERLTKIEGLARRSGFQVLDTGQEWKCKLHPPVLPSDDLAWICTECGDWMCKPQLNAPIKINMALNEALQNSVLGISEALCDDLVVCLSNPRYQVLSWFLPWADLHRLCIMYLQDPQTTKNIVTELKFVDIDYSIFKGIKREPLDELAGIERGYEQYLDHEFVSDEESSRLSSDDCRSQSSRSHSITSDGIYESSMYHPLLPPATPKSDPNTLKSLRMFRPNLKRSKERDSSDTVKEKRIKSDSYSETIERVISNPTDSSKPNTLFELVGPCQNAIKMDMDSSNYNSKNVKTATLPLLGGQVARKETELIQVNQTQIHTPTAINNSSNQITVNNNNNNGYTSAKKTLMLKLLTQHLIKRSSMHLNTESNSSPHQVDPESTAQTKNSIKMVENHVIHQPVETNQQSVKVEPVLKCHQTQTTSNQLQARDDKSSLIIQVPLSQLQQDNNFFQRILQHRRPRTPPIVLNQSQTKFSSSNSKLLHLLQNQHPESLNQNPLPNSFCNSLKAPKLCHNSDKPPLLSTLPLAPPQHKKISTQNVSTMQSIPQKLLDKIQSTVLTIPLCNLGLIPKTPQEPTRIKQGIKSDQQLTKTCQYSPNVDNRSLSTKQISASPTHHKIITPEKNSHKISSIKRQESVKISSTGQYLLCSQHGETCRSPEPESHQSHMKIQDSNYSNHMTLALNNVESSKKQFPNNLNSPCVTTDKNDDDENETTQADFKCNNWDKVQIKGNNIEETTNQGENKLSQNNNNYNSDNSDLYDDIPKNFNLTENIRKYTKGSTKIATVVLEDCVKTPVGGDKLNVCKNVNNRDSTKNEHSNVETSPTRPRELKVALCRLFSDVEDLSKKLSLKKEENRGIKPKCDRGRFPHKNSRRRKSTDESENDKNIKAPHVVQNHKLSPLQDVNLRVNITLKNNKCCDHSELPNKLEPLKMNYSNSFDKKTYARSVLANVPGLNNYEMLRPQNVDQIVNVVQVSGSRTASTVPIPNTQTSTQITPHIQRIGQPRAGGEQKPIENNAAATLTAGAIANTSTTTSSKTTSTQPSTLINILSQQIIKPAATTTSSTTTTIGQRRTPCINILSQQIIRPPTVTSKVTTTNINTSTINISSISNSGNNVGNNIKAITNNCTNVQENNQVKPVTVAAESAIVAQLNNSSTRDVTTKTTNTTAATTGQGSTILQFICKSTLPKFQQAFGKAVYQSTDATSVTGTAASTVETTTAASSNSTATTSTTSASDIKKTLPKSVPVNVQPIQGSVIYSRQVPVGQTISLIPPGGTTRQVFRIATSNPEQLSLVKDSVIHSKMSALLAAALQGRPKTIEGDVQLNSEVGSTKVTLTRPTLVQNARIVKPVQLQLPTNAVRAPTPNLSSTTLEQLREFDMVYKQIKERSSTTTPSECSSSSEQTTQEVTTQQRISVTYVNQVQKYTQLSPVVVVSSFNNLQPVVSPALSVTSQGSSSPCVTPASTPTLPKVTAKSSKGKCVKNSPNNIAKPSTIPKPQQKPQEDEHTTQRIFDILAEYAEQLRNSPDLNNKPAPRRRSNPPTNPNHNSKRKKSSSGSKKPGHTNNSGDIDTDDMTMGSEDSSGGGAVQLSVTDDEQSQAASSTPVETNENSSSSGSRQLILTDANVTTQSRNLIIADSSVGEALKMPNTAVIVPGSYIMPVSMVKGGQQIAVVSGGSKILATVPARSGQNMLLFQSFTNQNRKGGAISAVKYSTIQPLSGISSQSLAGVSAQPPVILPPNSVATAVALGHPLALKKIGNEHEHNEVLLTISPQKDETTSKLIATTSSADIVQPDSSTSISSSDINVKIDETKSEQLSNDKIYQAYQKSVITNSVGGTSVIATTSSIPATKADDSCNGAPTILNINMTDISDNNKGESKSNERMQSVLVTACTSNGPMLSHTNPKYKKSDIERTNNNDTSKEQFLHNGEKIRNNDQKTFKGTNTYLAKMKKINIASHKLGSELQKQAAIERELRLQKSLSEECEDLGVDEPSTSDLFPEADLLFDSNHSPSFDQSSQEASLKRASSQTGNEKDDNKASGINLFSDDENSGSLRADLFEYVEYQSVENALNYQAVQLINGTESSSVGSSGCDEEDSSNNTTTLHPKCSDISDVTLNSPIPEIYKSENNMNKYKFKYSNRKKCGIDSNKFNVKQQCEKMLLSGSDLVVSSTAEDDNDDDVIKNINNDKFKVVHVAIMKENDEEQQQQQLKKCQLHCHDGGDDLDLDMMSGSGRGARRSVRKLCSCCNGTTHLQPHQQDNHNHGEQMHQQHLAARKRPHHNTTSSRPATPHKKATYLKKR